MLTCRLLQILLLLTLAVGAPQRRRQRTRGQGRARLRGRVRSTTTTTTTTTTPVPVYEEEYDDYEQYEDYNYNDEEEDEDEGGWEKAREMLEEEVPARYGEQGYGQHEYVYLGPDRRKEEYEQEEEQSYGQEGRYDQNGYGYGGNSQEVGDRWNESRGSAVVRGRGEEFVRRTEPKEEEEEEEEEGACGPECRNRAHELDLPKEAERCPYEGMVIDVYGYCRYPSHSTGRDWLWWATMRQYIASGGNSGVW